MKKQTTDFGYQQVNIEEKQKLVAQVFDSVAHRYDLMNDLMSGGIHRLWKKVALSLCQLREGQTVLDVASGTGDLAYAMAKKVGPEGNVVLSDINPNMLKIAKDKMIDKGLCGYIDYVEANAEALPFPANTFDRIMIGFGLRNVTHKDKALSHFYRVLKPGGRLIVLEFSHPTTPLLGKLYDTYSFHVLPFLGKWVAKDSESYRYLAESIRMHPNQETLKEMIATAGFDNVTYQNLTGGIVAIHKGIKY